MLFDYPWISCDLTIKLLDTVSMDTCIAIDTKLPFSDTPSPGNDCIGSFAVS